VNTRTAELIKYANNALLATQISAINEIANIAAAVGGIDVMDVVEGVAADHRWSPRLSSGETVRPGILSYLIPGCGFGGSCFPKDVKALRSMADKVGVQPRVLQAVLDVNAAQPQQVTQLLKTQFDQLKDKSVLVLGLAFKPGTDDIRESVALRVIDDLTAEGSQIIAHDPIAHEHARAELSGNQSVTLVSDWTSYLDQVDAIIVTTLWDEYLTLSEYSLQQAIEGKVFIDCRRGFQPSQFKNSVYLAIGLTAAR
jgi:UDPglucose 6-dehydrogenase/GDP-mannose 6-dehydrogenase